jgi:hypothetical protein
MINARGRTEKGRGIGEAKAECDRARHCSTDADERKRRRLEQKRMRLDAQRAAFESVVSKAQHVVTVDIPDTAVIPARSYGGGMDLTLRPKKNIAVMMMYLHHNPPPPFNPDANPEYVRRRKQYHAALMKFQDSLPDSMSDKDFDAEVNNKARELRTKFGI